MNNLSNLSGKIKNPNTNWKYILIVVILAFIAGGIIGFQWWLVGRNQNTGSKNTRKQNIINPERGKPEEIISDDRILLTPENFLEILKREKENDPKAPCQAEFNTDSPTAEVLYYSQEKGISFKIPYNPKWGSAKYKILPYEEIAEAKGTEGIGEGVLFFGPILPEVGEGGCHWWRKYFLEFNPAQNTEKVVKRLKNYTWKEHEFEVREAPTFETINEFTVISYRIMAEFFSETRRELIGQKYNYTFGTNFDYTEKDIEDFAKLCEDLIKTIQFVE